ncbi:MAG: hypothetical protein ACF8OB_10350 [Phycisphaeraceae bacterium JB051]
MQTGGVVQQISKKPNVWFTVLEPPFDFTSPFNGEEYVLLVIVCDPRFTNQQRNHLAEQFVASGCRNAFCAGYACSRFDDAIDWAYMDTDPTGNYDPPDETFVMTSWYEDDPLKDVVETMFLIGDFDDLHFENFVVVMVGNQSCSNLEVLNALQNQVGDQNVEIRNWIYQTKLQVIRETEKS